MELVQTNLLTPMVLAFVLGVVAARVGSDLKLPDAIYARLSIYLIFALGILAASDSYIAAPAAVRLAIPEAHPSLHLTPVLAVTFPLDLTVGIPLFHTFARWLDA